MNLTREQVTAEADRRVQAALDRIEAAQREFARACQELCAIKGGLQQYERTSKLHQAIDVLWHRVAGWARKRQGTLDLDEFGRSALAKRLGGSDL